MYRFFRELGLSPSFSWVLYGFDGVVSWVVAAGSYPTPLLGVPTSRYNPPDNLSPKTLRPKSLSRRSRLGP